MEDEKQFILIHCLKKYSYNHVEKKFKKYLLKVNEYTHII